MITLLEQSYKKQENIWGLTIDTGLPRRTSGVPKLISVPFYYEKKSGISD